ncbi:ATP-binding cassette domain-containing protein [Phytoactinopolyspora endophytica]|uniref:ATP-binding cassette domain-containing protein n=1 Tax=Phytoactinopolyspora endophytica TaxID=1642495 RepID=UPI00101C5391|nr:ATP-binding cassette domain-containing protein [Phytoactinopolyspora endophytica]
MHAIETEGLTKRYGADHYAVRGLDLTVRDSEIYGFLGRNGAGKTTTMRMLVGLVTPTDGTIRFRGRRFDGNNAVAASRPPSMI